jgi:DNA-binding transcriptional MerR regulator
MKANVATVAITPLADIPRKRYYAIGEVSELCGIKPHVLRYWEQEFPQLKPTKRRGNRRYYQLDDVEMVQRIRSLLYEQGFTIGGARQRLRESRIDERATALAAAPILPPRPVPGSAPGENALSCSRQQQIHDLRCELEDLLSRLPG